VWERWGGEEGDGDGGWFGKAYRDAAAARDARL
jgi:hypothetical protein